MYIFLCVYFQQGHLGIQCIDFLVQALRENQNANKLKIQKCFYYFQISAIAVHSCISTLTVLLFLSEWLFLKVDLNHGTQLCLDHMLSCAWVIYSVCLGHMHSCAWIILHLLGAFELPWCNTNDLKKTTFFQYFRKNVFTSVRINWWHMLTTHLSFSERAHKSKYGPG